MANTPAGRGGGLALRVLKVSGQLSTLLMLRTICSMRAGRSRQADPAPLLHIACTKNKQGGR